MAYSAYDLNKRMDKMARDRAWRDRMAKPSQYNRYERHLADFREKEKLDAKNQREIALENRRQLGALDVQKENSRGALARQGLENKGRLADRELYNKERGRQSDQTHGLELNKFDFDRIKENRKFGLDKEKERFDQFSKLKGLDNSGSLGGVSPSTKGGLMNEWNTFRENSGGLTSKAMDFAIAKKLKDAKANGIPLEKINFTDAERNMLVSGINGGGADADQNRRNRLDWVEVEGKRRQYFDQSGREVAFNPPPGRADFSGFPNRSKPAHGGSTGVGQQSVARPTVVHPKQESEPYAGYTNIKPGTGKFSNTFWGTDPSGKTRRIDFARPLLPSGLPNPDFPKRTAFREKIGYPQTKKEQEAYQAALKKLKNIQRIER